ncbi:MAG: creatininase family protein, partial [Gemmatimonadaceae bacterium]
MARPVDALNSVWIEELTWIEIRDALAAGKKTIIIPTGGIEQNGPYVAMGKHNVILRGQCESLARRLGNALCAPVVAFVPEGNFDPPSGHMRYPGSISLTEPTFRALLDDIA